MKNQSDLKDTNHPSHSYRLLIGQMIGEVEEVEGISELPEPRKIKADENISQMSQWPKTTTVGAITARGIVFTDNAGFQTWKEATMGHSNQPETIRLTRLDEKGHPMTEWTLEGAYPTDLDMRSPGNAEDGLIRLDSMDLTYERIRKRKLK